MKMTKNIPLLIFSILIMNLFFKSSFFSIIYSDDLMLVMFFKYLAGLKTVGIFIYALLLFLILCNFFSVKTHRREISFLFKHFSKEDIITLQPPN